MNYATPTTIHHVQSLFDVEDNPSQEISDTVAVVIPRTEKGIQEDSQLNYIMDVVKEFDDDIGRTFDSYNDTLWSYNTLGHFFPGHVDGPGADIAAFQVSDHI